MQPERGAFLLLDAFEQINSIEPAETREIYEKVVAIITELTDQESAR